jgi:hypothetical protein
MEDRPSIAFCKILFGHNGGTFTAKGLPRFGIDDVRGNCDRGFDCGECSLLHEWLKVMYAQGWAWSWECDRCLRETEKANDVGEDRRFAQGFYQSGGTTQGPSEISAPTLPGCTRCGWESSFLQLVLRKPK